MEGPLVVHRHRVRREADGCVVGSLARRRVGPLAMSISRHR